MAKRGPKSEKPDKIRQMLAQDFTVRQISRALDVSTQRVYALIKYDQQETAKRA